MFSSPLGSRMAVASFVPSVQNHSRRVCPHPFFYHARPPPLLREGQRTPHVCACAYAYVRVRKTYLLCRYSYSSLGNAFITHERYDSVIESLSCSQRGMVLINGFGQRMGKQRSARSCGTSISKASGMFLPPAHKPAALSSYAGPLPGRRTLCNCPTPNLDASPVYFSVS